MPDSYPIIFFKGGHAGGNIVPFLVTAFPRNGEEPKSLSETRMHIGFAGFGGGGGGCSSPTA